MATGKKRAERDIEKGYSKERFVVKLRRLADCIEQGKRFQIQVAGKKSQYHRLPASASNTNADHLWRNWNFRSSGRLRGRPYRYPEQYLKALKVADAAPYESLVVEDSEQGLKSALAAGIPCIVVKNHCTGDVHDFTGAAAELSTITELLASIDRIFS